MNEKAVDWSNQEAGRPAQKSFTLHGFEFKQSTWDGETNYYYLSEADSKTLDELKDSDDAKDQQIVKLIVDKARSSRADHCNSDY